jgi:hypothetical protein
MHEAHTLPGHGIFIATAEVEDRRRDCPIDRGLNRHEGVIAVNNDPWAFGAGQRGERGNSIEYAAAVEQAAG